MGDDGVMVLVASEGDARMTYVRMSDIRKGMVIGGREVLAVWPAGNLIIAKLSDGSTLRNPADSEYVWREDN